MTGLIVIILPIIIASHLRHQDGADIQVPWAPSDVADLVSEDQSRITRLPPFRTEWVIYAGELEVHEDALQITEEPSSNLLTEVARAELLWDNGTFRLTYSAASGQNIVQIWDGANCIQSTFDGAHIEYGQKFAPPDDRAFLHLINGMEEVAWLRHKILSVLIREGMATAQSVAGNILTWACAPPGSTDFFREFDLDTSEHTMVRVSDVFLTNADSPEFRLRLDRIIDNWETYGGYKLPSRGHAVVSSITPDGVTLPDGRIYVKYYVYERKEMEFLSQSAPSIAVDLKPGAEVIDTRIGLKFRVGATRLTVDGLSYEAKEPITVHPGDDLPAILSSAQVVPTVAAESESASSTTLPLLLGVGTGMGMLAALWIIRKRA